MYHPRMPRFASHRRRIPSPQGPISYTAAMDAFRSFQATQDTMERRYLLSERVHVRISANRNNDFEFQVYLTIEGADSSSWWPGDMTPQEMIKCAEIKAMVDDWKSGRIDALPPSTATRPIDDNDTV